MEREVRDFVTLYERGVISADHLRRVFRIFLTVPLIERRRRLPRSLMYGRFNLDLMRDEDVQCRFRFRRNDITRLMSCFALPHELFIPVGTNQYRVPGLTALCIVLRRLAYPNRLFDLEPMFGYAKPTLSAIITSTTRLMLETKGHLLHDLRNLSLLNVHKLEEYAQSIYAKGAALQDCWAFIDGTARQICRPSVDQERYFSGHKRYHCLKYQGITTPDGIIANLAGPFEGRRHDAGMWRESGVMEQLRNVCDTPRRTFVLYSDPAYPISNLLITPFPVTSNDPNAAAFNTSMSTVRQAVEWGFGKVLREFAFIDFSKNQKLLLQDLECLYKLAVLFTNCHTCLYGSQIGDYFEIEPPTLEEYLGQ